MAVSLVSDALVSLAQRSLGNNAWSVEYVVRIGAQLAVAASLYPNLSSKDRNDLVCQTILKMLDDVEKVEKEQTKESTETEKTKFHLEECRWAVKNVLPVCLDLLAPLKVPNCLPSFPCLARLRDWFVGCKKNPVVEAVSALGDALKHPQEYLEEMRDLVSKVEKLVSASGRTDLLKDLPVFSPEPVAPEAAAPVAPVAPAAPVAPVEAAASSAIGSAPGKSSARSLRSDNSSALASSETRVPSASSAQSAPSSQLPPSPESPLAQLPGELANLSDVELSQ